MEKHRLVREPSAASVPALVAKLDADGFVCLDDALPDGWLDATRASIHDHIAQHGDRDFFIFGPGDHDATAARDFVAGTGIHELMDGLLAARWPRAHTEPHVASCLRVLAAGSHREDPLLLHYDAKIVTIVVPIFLPDGPRGRSGELVAIANKRPFRRFVLAHVVDKVLTHNPRYRRRVVDAIVREPERYVVDLEPGHAYMFWGYRTLHGNLPCAPGQMRSTLVIQYGEPHPDSIVMRMVRRRRARRLSRWMDANQAIGTRDALAG